MSFLFFIKKPPTHGTFIASSNTTDNAFSQQIQRQYFFLLMIQERIKAFTFGVALYENNLFQQG